MNDLEFGTVKLHLKEIMEERGLSLSKLSFRAEMQRTQLKHYYDGWLYSAFRYCCPFPTLLCLRM